MKKKNFLLLVIICFIQVFGNSAVQAQNEKDFSINGIPVIHIDLLEPGTITKEDKLKARMRIENANGSNYSEEYLYNGMVLISGRGNSTWAMPKKPYNLDLITDNGDDNPASLLGMPADEEWAIIASYSDKSFLRIPVAYYLGNVLGMQYSPKTRFVEIYLNGTYAGFYILCEKIKKAEHRVNIEKLSDKAADQKEPNITGGYIVEVTPKDRITADEKYVTSNMGINFVFKYPKKKNITDAQMQWMKQYLNKVETSIYSADFKDSINGYRKYIDVDSFVDWYLINEIAKNTDARFFGSVFLTKTRNGKLMLGPVWDFDIGFGNADYNVTNEENGFWVKYTQWIHRLFDDEYFAQKVSDRFDQLKSVFDTIPLLLSTAGKELKNTGVIDKNFQKWPILGKYVWPNYAPYPKTYEGEIRRLTDWFQERTDWLYINLPIKEEEPCQRLKTTKPHISITDTDEFGAGTSTRIKTTRGYTSYIWNGKKNTSYTTTIKEGGKSWVQVEDAHGCLSPVSDTLYFIAQAKINIDSSVFVYDGTAKKPFVSTIPAGLNVTFTYDGDSIAPTMPGTYQVKATILSPFHKPSPYNTTLVIKKASQQIQINGPDQAYYDQRISFDATATSNLPVHFQLIQGEGTIVENNLHIQGVGSYEIKVTQQGDERYEAATPQTFSLTAYKAAQQINFPPLPALSYMSKKILLNATASSGLAVQYIVSKNGVIAGNQVSPLKAGELIIWAIQPGNEFYEAADTISQSTWVEYSDNFSKNLQVFPTPFYHSLTVVYPHAEQTNLKIYNSSGLQVGAFTLKGHTTTLNLPALAKGIYILHFSSSRGSGSYKVLKQ